MLHALASRVIGPLLYGNARTGSDINVSVSESTEFSSSLLSGAKIACWYFSASSRVALQDEQSFERIVVE